MAHFGQTSPDNTQSNLVAENALSAGQLEAERNSAILEAELGMQIELAKKYTQAMKNYRTTTLE